MSTEKKLALTFSQQCRTESRQKLWILCRVNAALIGGRSKSTESLPRSNWPPAPAPERRRPRSPDVPSAAASAPSRPISARHRRLPPSGSNRPWNWRARRSMAFAQSKIQQDEQDNKRIRRRGVPLTLGQPPRRRRPRRRRRARWRPRRARTSWGPRRRREPVRRGPPGGSGGNAPPRPLDRQLKKSRNRIDGSREEKSAA